MKHLNTALKQAMRSEFRQRLGAVIFKGQRILGVGYNRVGCSQNRLKASHWQDSRHAEVDALLDALRRHSAEELRGADILVVRLKKDNSFGLALPCNHCYNTLKNIGIRRVHFSDNDGNFSEIRI